MNQWFRSWHGAPTDPKWRTVARRAGVPVAFVTAVVWTLLDRASQSADRGSIAGYDAEVLADALGIEPEQVEEIINALHVKGVLEDERFTGWSKHQPAREDGSAERAKEWRERKKAEANVAERTRTQATGTERPREDTDTDTDTSEADASETRERKREDRSSVANLEFERWYAGYPHKVGKADARKAFDRARRKASLQELIEGRDRYIRDKPPDRSWCNPSTFLNQERWTDEPSPDNPNRMPPPRHHDRGPRGFDAVLAGVGRVARQRGLTEPGRDAGVEPSTRDPGVVDADWWAAESH